MISRPAWLTYQILGQPGLQHDPYAQKKKKNLCTLKYILIQKFQVFDFVCLLLHLHE